MRRKERGKGNADGACNNGGERGSKGSKQFTFSEWERKIFQSTGGLEKSEAEGGGRPRLPPTYHGVSARGKGERGKRGGKPRLSLVRGRKRSHIPVETGGLRKKKGASTDKKELIPVSLWQR